MNTPEIKDSNSTDIAIIGMSGRFPGASNVDEFWENLKSGKISFDHFTEDELRAAGVAENDLSDPGYVRVAPRIANAEDFDAEYFNFSPVEASFIDPQQRIFLECSVEALENSGCDFDRFPGNIGIFAGAALNIRHLSRALTHFDETLGEPQLFVILSNDKDYIATRTSYKLNLSGPSVNVQAACSTSLVAVHLACQSLLAGECDIALAGGASVVFSYAKLGYRFSEGSVFSADGTCRPFDADACGTVFGDGVGIVVLKRLNDAVLAGDNIRAVIKASALNNDGGRKASFAAPSSRGQAEVIAEAIAMSGVPIDSIGFIEAHGTGTPVGDPIEIEGLKRVFRDIGAKRSCAIGSIKGNIGHLNAAAGVAGLIKTVFAIETGKIPPTAHFTKLNPNINFSQTPFFINSDLIPWVNSNPLRRACVSSFGIGGTNAHLVLEGAPRIDPQGPKLFHNRAYVLTARTQTALEQMADRLSSFLSVNDAINMADLAYTLSEGRSKHEFGLAVVAPDPSALANRLKLQSHASSVRGKSFGKDADVAFVFPGQGTQSLAMGVGIYRHEPAYRNALDQCISILRQAHDLDLAPFLLPKVDADEHDGSIAKLLERTDFAQPAVFSVSYALAQLWLSWGVKPTGLIGHSLGEIVAACVAGVFSLEDALKIVSSRGRLMNTAQPGSMVAVMSDPEAIVPLLSEELTIASYNGPQACVVSGPTPAINEFLNDLVSQGISHTFLRTSHAFHSASMEIAVEPFINHLSSIGFKPPRIPFVSNLTGQWITDEQAVDPAYWGKHIREPVRFAQGVSAITAGFTGILLEVGPGRQMSGLINSATEQSEFATVATLPRPGEVDAEHDQLLLAASSLCLAGIEIDWGAINRTKDARKIPLPTYPFQRRTYSLAPAYENSQKPGTNPSAIAATAKLYEPIWTRCEIGHSLPGQARKWLIFSNEDALSTHLIQSLRATGAEITVLRKADAFEYDDDFTFAIKSGDAAQLTRALESFDDDKQHNSIVYLWSLGLETNDPEAIQSSYLDILHLVSTLQIEQSVRQTDLFLLSANSQDVLSAGDVEPAGAALLGLARSLSQELECLSVSYLDLCRHQLEQDRVAATTEVIMPVLSGTGSRILAWRNGRFWSPALAPLARKVQTTALQIELIQGGAWLITGGLGGIGLAIAEELVQRGIRKLALVSRRKMPAEELWPRKIAENTADSDILRRLDAMVELGVELVIITADVADHRSFKLGVEQAQAKLGRISAVIHAAGTVNGSQLITKTDAMALEVLRPKISGLLNLSNIFSSQRLDLIILCSSVTTLLSNPGQTDYAFANAFMDSFASRISQCASRTISLNWDSWSEVGMAAKYQVPEAFRDIHDAWLKSALSTNDAVACFFEALNFDLPRIAVSRMELDSNGQFIQAATAQVETSVAGILHPRPDLGVDYADPRTDLEATAARIMAEMLNLQSVGIDDNFLDLGCHSLTATRFAAKMRQESGVTIPLAVLFDGLTLRSTFDALQIEEWEEIEI